MTWLDVYGQWVGTAIEFMLITLGGLLVLLCFLAVVGAVVAFIVDPESFDRGPHFPRRHRQRWR